MISRIRGKVVNKKNDSLVIDVNGICYEVLIPAAIMRSLEEKFGQDGEIELFTYHYHQVDPSKSIPVLVGFLNEVEKEFFERFITVSGIGPKAAVRAMSLPISTIAQAIDTGNMGVLKSLQGIGEQRAREIIAKLQGKVGKFGLIQDKEIKQAAKIGSDIESEAMEVLAQLQYKTSEAKEMIRKAIERNPDVKTAEDLLNEVYKQKQVK